jgi:hypothetical protein
LHDGVVAVRPKAVVARRQDDVFDEIARSIGPKYRCRPLRRCWRRPLGRWRCRLIGRQSCRLLGSDRRRALRRRRCRRRGWRARRRSMRAQRRSPFHARGAGAALAHRWMRCAAPMMPRRMAEPAEHRPEGSCHHSQQHGRTKSRSGVRIGRNGEREGDGSNDGNCSGAHDRSPARCRIRFNRRVVQKFQLQRRR